MQPAHRSKLKQAVFDPLGILQLIVVAADQSVNAPTCCRHIRIGNCQLDVQADHGLCIAWVCLLQGIHTMVKAGAMVGNHGPRHMDCMGLSPAGGAHLPGHDKKVINHTVSIAWVRLLQGTSITKSKQEGGYSCAPWGK
eukprot:1137191-Pelagomonas_calceolata.AAC.1